MGYAFPSPGSETVDAPTATLEEVDIRSELAARPHRSPNYADENQARWPLRCGITAWAFPPNTCGAFSIRSRSCANPRMRLPAGSGWD